MRTIPTNDNLKRLGIELVSRCWCCEDKKEKTMSHILLTAPIAFKLWRQFALFAGVQINNPHLQQMIITWWTRNQLQN